MKHSKRVSAAVLCCGALLQAACSSWAPGDEPVDGGKDVGTVAQAALAPASLTRWQMPVSICFTNTTRPDQPTDVAPTGTDFTDLADAAFSAVNDTWGSLPGLAFTRLSSCPTDGVFMKLNILYALPGYTSGGGCGFGSGASCDLFMGNEATFLHFQAVTIHEVGHGLGLVHEHQRPDRPVMCPDVEDPYNACLRCKADADVGGVCTAADWNGCLRPVKAERVTVDQFAPPGSALYATMTHAYDNFRPFICTPETPGECLRILTRYDPLSIMNYCGPHNGRDTEDPLPTNLDNLGMNILYPNLDRLSSHLLGCRTGCFRLGPSELLMVSSSSVVADWTAEGALGIVPTWEMRGPLAVVSRTEEDLSPASIVTDTISFSYEDTFGLTHSGSGVVRVSDSKFTGLLQMLL